MTIAGRTLAQHQLDVLLRLDCQRIVCIAPQLIPEIIALQHQSEAANASFHLLDGPRRLASIVDPADAVLALQDGLFVITHLVTVSALQPNWVAVQPVEQGLALGFERIDANHAAAGLLQVDGTLVRELADLPEDIDVYSALQRLAVQASAPMQDIGTGAELLARPTLIRNFAEAEVLEARWVELCTQLGPDAQPTERVLRPLVRAFGLALLDSPGGVGALLVGTGLLIALALGAGLTGYPVLGLAFAGLGKLVWTIRGLACGILADRSAAASPVLLGGFRLSLDLVLVVLMVLLLSGSAANVAADHVFPPVLMIAVLHLVEQVAPPVWRGWLADRTVLILCVVVAAVLNLTGLAVQSLALAVVLLGILFVSSHSRLTRL